MSTMCLPSAFRLPPSPARLTALTPGRAGQRGLTLMELLVASTISLVVILAVGQLDVSRILLSQQVRETSTVGSEAQLAVLQFVRDAQQADRVNLGIR